MKFFFDTYAIMEIFQGNENFKKYLKNDIITSKINILETYYHLLRTYDEKTANKYCDQLLGYVEEIKYDDIKLAAKKRIEFQAIGHNVSFADCIGYAISQRLKIKFLTGDKEFKNIENVEWVE